MIFNADTNYDGKISFDEFVRILTLQAGSDSLWGRAEKSLWAKFRRGIGESIGVASDIVESTAEPLRQIMRNNSYLSSDGKFHIAGAGSRFASDLVYLCVLLAYAFIFGSIIINYSSHNAFKNLSYFARQDEIEAAIYRNGAMHCFVLFNFVFFSLVELQLWSQGRTIAMWLWGLKCIEKDTGKTLGFNKMLKAKGLYILSELLGTIVILGILPVSDIELFKAFNFDLALKCNSPTQILSILLFIDGLFVFAYDGATLFESMVGAQVVVKPGKTLQIKGN